MLACIDGDHIAFDDGRLLGRDLNSARFCPHPDALRRHIYALGLGARDVGRLLSRFQVRFPIRRLKHLVGGTWPVLEVSWRDGYNLDSRQLGLSWSPRATWTPSDGERTVEQAVEQLMEYADDHNWPGTRQGWWRTPHVPWETVSRFPDHGEGYRRRGEPILATTAFPTGLRAWWGMLNRRADDAAPQRVALTADYVYGRFQDHVARVPRFTLRKSYLDGQFAIFVFGRRTTLAVDRTSGLARMLTAQISRNVRIVP